MSKTFRHDMGVACFIELIQVCVHRFDAVYLQDCVFTNPNKSLEDLHVISNCLRMPELAFCAVCRKLSVEVNPTVVASLMYGSW